VRKFLLLLSSLTVFVWSNAGLSQNYPNRPVRIIVGFETAGGPDTTARIIGPQLSLQMEAGVSGTEMDASWNGLFAPAKTPADIVARLETEVRKALAVPEVRERFHKVGLNPLGTTSAEFKPLVAFSVKRFGEAARLAGIEPE
jgi:tripartite-type tricarboxylate transporter receptor subunit TctC